MEKVRFGLIGIGAQGGAYAGFLTGKGGMFGMRRRNALLTARWERYVTLTPRRKRCAGKSIPNILFTETGKNGGFRKCGRGYHYGTPLSAYGNRNLLLRAWHERSGRKACRSLCKSGS